MRLTYAFVTALALVASPAWPADHNGFYTGASIGDFSLSADGFSGSDFGYKLFVGYDFGKYFAVEGAYADGGKPSDHGASISVTAWDLAVLGKWPVTEQFDLFAKLGYAWWDAKLHDYYVGASDSDSDLMYGLGMGYQFTDQFGMLGEYERIDIANTSKADLFSVGVVWRF